MPIYEYECTKCGRIEEALQKISEPPLETCRHCNGSLHKLVSQSSFHLKGSGWYVTDYGGSPAKGTSSSDTKNTSAGKNVPACKAKTTDTGSQKKE